MCTYLLILVFLQYSWTNLEFGLDHIWKHKLKHFTLKTTSTVALQYNLNSKFKHFSPSGLRKNRFTLFLRGSLGLD